MENLLSKAALFGVTEAAVDVGLDQGLPEAGKVADACSAAAGASSVAGAARAAGAAAAAVCIGTADIVQVIFIEC